MIGVLGYRESIFMVDLMNKINKPFEWMKYRQLPIPFSNDYRLIIDRVSFQDRFLNTALKIQSLNGVYVINNPFTTENLSKGIDLTIMKKLKIPFPKTFMLPKFSSEWDMNDIVGGVDWDLIQKEFSFPLIFKPLMGWGWSDVFEIKTLQELKEKYEFFKEKKVMLVQQKVESNKFLRVFCVGNEAKVMGFNPAPGGAGRIIKNLCSVELTKKIEEQSLLFCKTVDLDFNVVEWAVKDDEAFIIDAFNPTPDVTKENLPEQYYDWIVSTLSDLVLKKYDSMPHNKKLFL